jgi:hypothetical protein
MNKFSLGQSFRDFILIGAGILAAVWFFTGYPSQDPRSMIQLPAESEINVELKAAERLSELGYSISEYSTVLTFEDNHRLLDSLQKSLGRSTAIRRLNAQTDPDNIKPYFWQLRFSGPPLDSRQIESGTTDDVDPDEDVLLTVRVDTEGQIFELHNNSELLPVRPVERSVLQKVLVDTTDSATATLLASVSDSLLRHVLYFDIPRSVAGAGYRHDASENLTPEHLKQGLPYRLSVDEMTQLATHYLEEFGWNTKAFSVDTVTAQRLKALNTALVRFETQEPILGQRLAITARVTPTGDLIELKSHYDSSTNSLGSWENIWNIFRGALVFFFALASIIIFFFRIRARAIDTKSALVVAILAGLIVSACRLLEEINGIKPFSGSAQGMEVVFLAMMIGIVGAFSSVAFFVLFSIGDSITRQYWNEKLQSFDYLRQGLVFNKPIGYLVLRSLILALILTGVWTSALWLLPELYIRFEFVFLSYAVSWPPLFLLLKTGWFSFCMIVIAFLIVGNQVYAQTRNRILAGIAASVACGIVIPVVYDFGPPLEEFTLGLILGGALTLIYLRWDFLTVLLSHFLFLGFLGSSSGWIISGSPDTYVFVLFLFFVAFLCTGATLAMLKGRDERGLTRYVPEYVEELAHEERIRQELQIAREVQQSFLPVRMPKIQGLDVAAFCRPAYETGGDYFDFIQLDEHCVAVAIGDVSGKGIQAAFYMTFTKGILHSLCRETDSPAELLIKANRLFCDNARKGTFISLVYGIIDLQKRTFTFARAGHNPVIRMNAKLGEVEELQPVGLGLGLTKDAPFSDNIREIRLDLCTDDILVLYTDGIVEALNEAREFYGNKRLVSLLKRHKKHSSSEILNAIFENVSTFVGKAKQHDDMTTMVIRLRDSEA